jgi:hypothetical protein
MLLDLLIDLMAGYNAIGKALPNKADALRQVQNTEDTIRAIQLRLQAIKKQIESEDHSNIKLP